MSSGEESGDPHTSEPSKSKRVGLVLDVPAVFDPVTCTHSPPEHYTKGAQTWEHQLARPAPAPAATRQGHLVNITGAAHIER